MPSIFRSFTLRAACTASTLLTLFAAASLPAPADPPKHVQVVQTFEPARDNGTPLVQVRFSNTVIGTFAIDIGEYSSVMTDTFAAKLGLKPTAYQGAWLGFRTPFFTTIQVPQFGLAGLTVRKETFRLVTQSFLPPFSDRPIDGLLGGDLLSRFALRVDYPAHEIGWIIPGNLSREDAAELGFSPQSLIELGQKETDLDGSKINHYTLRADFQNGGTVSSEDLFIDTGALETLVSNPMAEKLHLLPQSTINVSTLSNPTASFTRSTVAQMQIGQTVLSDVSVLAPQSKKSGFPSLLGENVLSDCVVLLDFGPHRFYLRPVLPPVKADAVVPADKKQIDWDRLRASPDQPSIEEMLGSGFAPEAGETIAEQVKPLQVPLGDHAKDSERLEKLGALLRLGQDESGSKAAFAEAVTEASAAAKARPADGVLAGHWVDALLLAGQYEEAQAAAVQNMQHLPGFAPGWRQLGGVQMSRVLFLLLGRQETVTETKVLQLTLPQGSPLTKAQGVFVQYSLMQAHAAFNQALALAPTDADGYRQRGVFRFVSLLAVSALQQAKLPLDLPDAEKPSTETALALTLADWQQGAALSPNDPEWLAGTAFLDRSVPFFHDRAWLTTHLKDTGQPVPTLLMTADMAQARLMALTKSTDKTLAASAWTSLGTVQFAKEESSADADVSWRQALVLSPSQPEALRLLATHLRRTEKWTELHDLLTKQCAAQDTVPARLTLAVYLNGASQSADAEAQVRAAKMLAPSNAFVNLVLVDLLLARSSGNPAALAEAKVCLDTARLGYGTLATARQKASLGTSEAVWLALDHDPAAAEKQLATLAREQPNSTQVREALAALVPY